MIAKAQPIGTPFVKSMEQLLDIKQNRWPPCLHQSQKNGVNSALAHKPGATHTTQQTNGVNAMTESRTTYLGFTIWPVLNDDDQTIIDYYDIHQRGDTRGEGEPIASFNTRTECAAWIRHEANDLRFIHALDNMRIKP